MNVLRAIRGFLALSSLFVVMHAEVARAQWIQTNGPKGGSIRSFVAIPNGAGVTRLFAGQQGVWTTDDNGASWVHHDDGLTDPNSFSLLAVPNGSGGNDILIGTNGGVFRSTDNGLSWTAINNGITNLTIYALAAGPNGSGGTNLYAGGFLGQAFRSTNNGASWTSITNGLPVNQAHIGVLATTAAGTVLAGTGNGIYRSTNFGASWTRVRTDYGFSFARQGTTIIAGTSNGVYRSTNDGATWTPINNGMAFSWVNSVAMIPNGGGATLFAGTGRVMRSTDNGATWTVVDNGLPVIGVPALVTVPNGSGGMDLYAGTPDGIYRTTNNGDSWTNVSFVSSYVRAVEVTPSGAVLAGTDLEIFRSTDAGANWTDTQLGAGILDFAINLHGASGVSLFACDALSGVHKSTDDGATWLDSNNGIDDIEVNSITVVANGSGGSNVIAGTYSGISISTSDGAGWQKVEPMAMPLDWVVIPNGASGDKIFGGGFGGIWVSTNHGFTWTSTGFGGTPRGMATTLNGANVFAGGDPFGVVRSTNQGATWDPVNTGLTNLAITSLLSPDGTNLFAGGGGGVFLSMDQGASWTSVGTGLPTGVFSLAVSSDGSTLLAGTTGFGVWKRPLAEMLQTPVGVSPSVTPRGPSLLTVRTNPAFGPVEFVVIGTEQADAIEIFDIGGRRVEVLALPAGGRTMPWHWSQAGRPPGVYLARLHSRSSEIVRFVVVQ